jgi:prephenate dehydrogenase
MKNYPIPNPDVLLGSVDNIEADLRDLHRAIEAKDWLKVRDLFNRVHLDAMEQRDYLYRSQDKWGTTIDL